MSWPENKASRGASGFFERLFRVLFWMVVLFIGWNLWVVLEGGLRSIRSALQDPGLRFSIRLSLSTATVSTAVCMLLAIPCAYTLAIRPSRFTRIGEAIVGLPLSLPYLVLGLCLLTAFSSPLGKFLKGMGIRVVFHPLGIVLAHILVNLPFVVKLTTEAFRRQDPDLRLTAETQGASRLQSFWYISLPLSRAELCNAMVLAWSRGLGEFGATLMLVGVTRMKTETLPGNIYLNISTGENGAALAAALILLMLSLLAQILGWMISRRSDEL